MATYKRLSIDYLKTELERISAAERKVLTALAKGNDNNAIAKACDISVNTVKMHLRNIYKKWNVATRKEATAKYLSLTNGEMDAADIEQG